MLYNFHRPFFHSITYRAYGLICLFSNAITYHVFFLISLPKPNYIPILTAAPEGVGRVWRLHTTATTYGDGENNNPTPASSNLFNNIPYTQPHGGTGRREGMEAYFKLPQAAQLLKYILFNNILHPAKYLLPLGESRDTTFLILSINHYYIQPQSTRRPK